jgi:hypothetical protein
MLHQVNNRATSNVPANGTYQPPNNGATDTGTDTIKPPPPPEPAAILDVSAMGRQLATLQLRMFDPANPLFKFDDGSFFSAEAMAQRKAASAKSLLEPDTSRQIHVTGMEGTLQKLVLDVVNSKMDPATANKFTAELSHLIQGTWDVFGNPNETLEERVGNREKGLKLAEYIAENYIDEPDEKQRFLDGVKHFYNNAVLRDKGYVVIEGPQEQILKPEQSITGINISSFDMAWKAAVKSVSTMSFTDESERLNAQHDEYIKNLLSDPKNAEVAKLYEAGEINLGAAMNYMMKLARYGSIDGPSFGSSNKTSTGNGSPDTLVVNEKTVANTIEQVKNSLDMDAIKEEVQRMVKSILSTFMSYDDYVAGGFYVK